MNTIVRYTILSAVCAPLLIVRPQDVQNSETLRLGFPFQLTRGMTGSQVAEEIDLHFGNKRARESHGDEFELFDLSEPKDSLFFDESGPVNRLSYFLFRDTLLYVILEFPPDRSIPIDTASFAQRYEYITRNGLIFRDSFIVVQIEPRKDHPSIAFFDIGLNDRMFQHLQDLEERLTEDSVVLVVVADSVRSFVPERTIRGSEQWQPSALTLGERIRFEDIKTTVEFMGIGMRKSQREAELSAKNATVFLVIERGGLKRQVTVGAAAERICLYCECAGIGNDLPTWVVCISGFRKLPATYQISININQSFQH